MDALIELVFKSYGLVGFLILTPIFGVLFLWRAYLRQMRSHAVDMKAAHNETRTAQEARVSDAQKIVDKLMELAGEQASLNKETNLLLSNINMVLERLARGG